MNIVPRAVYGISDSLSDEANGVPILRMNNIQAGKIDASELKYSSKSLPQGFSSRFDQLQLNWAFRLLLDYDSTIPDATTGDDITDAYLDHIAAAKLAVDGAVEERTVAQAAMLIEPETDRPHLLRFERTLGAEQSAFIPGTKFVERGIDRRMPHRSSPGSRFGTAR